ncbi:hypothetical protein PR048_011613 [Dryococelus australis]|uniref:Uncharacterized protein n=1 Tax=Dryococelus australis TaxID=614101 RepID=A0ABQ9HM41_9NEOP|nr:hypothetical protein PR048_011613 [Dryococelus australis]
MFCKTLGISTKRVNTALTKLRGNQLLDKRGKLQGSKDYVSAERVNEVIEHMKKVPKYTPHYRREENSSSEILPLYIAISKRYAQYRPETSKSVGY